MHQALRIGRHPHLAMRSILRGRRRIAAMALLAADAAFRVNRRLPVGEAVSQRDRQDFALVTLDALVLVPFRARPGGECECQHPARDHPSHAHLEDLPHRPSADGPRCS